MQDLIAEWIQTAAMCYKTKKGIENARTQTIPNRRY